MSTQEGIAFPPINQLLIEFSPIKTKEIIDGSPESLDSPNLDALTSSTLVNTSTSTSRSPNYNLRPRYYNPNHSPYARDLGNPISTRRNKSNCIRDYRCTNCGYLRSYVSKNHLKAHVTTKRYGARRLPSDYYIIQDYLRRVKKYRLIYPKMSENLGIS